MTNIREATKNDISAMVWLFFDDGLGSTREQAQKFYDGLDFTGSHIGMKIYI